jgi:hypothetical protein
MRYLQDNRRGWPFGFGCGRQYGAVLCGLLLWTGVASAQAPADDTLIVGNDISQAELEKLKQRHASDAEMIAAAESKTRTIKIEAGGYQLVGLKDNVKLPVLFRETDGEVLNRIGIKAGETWVGWLRKKGEAQPSLVEIPAAAYQRYILIGKKAGLTSVLIVENGEAGKTAPKVLAQLNVTVGNPPPVDPVDPPPPPPSNDVLVKAAQADVAAGKGTSEDVKFYREYFATWANQLPGIVNYKDNYAFLDAFDDGVHARLGKLSDGGKLPTMRRAIADEFNAKLPKTQVAFDATVRTQYADALRAVADRLKGYQ